MATLEAVLDAVDPAAVVDLTRELVRRPSVVRPDRGEGEAEVAGFAAAWLRSRGFTVHTDEVAPGRPNVIAVLDSGRPGPTLLFEAHTDVVTEGDPASWTHPPFSAAVDGDRIYGRGACDTKGNLAAAIVAATALRRAGLPRRGRLMLACPVDEEGMMAGIRHFIAAGWADGVDAAVICEPEENRLCIAQKGALRARLTVRGAMAHGAMPLSGVNPVPAAAELIRRLAELERAEIDRHGFDDLLGYPSVTPTVVRAPTAGEPQLNVVPEEVEVLVDIRTIRGQSHAALLSRLRAACAAVERAANEDLARGHGSALRERLHEGLKAGRRLAVSLEVLDERPWTETDPATPIVRAAAAGVRAATGAEPVYAGVPGATDGTFLAALKGIPVVVTGAGDRFVPHQRDEWVAIPQLVDTARIYAATAWFFLEGKA